MGALGTGLGAAGKGWERAGNLGKGLDLPGIWGQELEVAMDQQERSWICQGFWERGWKNWECSKVGLFWECFQSQNSSSSLGLSLMEFQGQG